MPPAHLTDPCSVFYPALPYAHICPPPLLPIPGHLLTAYPAPLPAPFSAACPSWSSYYTTYPAPSCQSVLLFTLLSPCSSLCTPLPASPPPLLSVSLLYVRPTFTLICPFPSSLPVLPGCVSLPCSLLPPYCTLYLSILPVSCCHTAVLCVLSCHHDLLPVPQEP